MATSLPDRLVQLRSALEDGQPGSPLIEALQGDSPDAGELLRALGGDLDGATAEAWNVLTGVLGKALGKKAWRLDVPGVEPIVPRAPLPDIPPLPQAAVLRMSVPGGGEWRDRDVPGAVGVRAFELELELGEPRIAMRAVGLRLEAEDPSGVLTMLGFGPLAITGDVGAVFDERGFRFAGGSQQGLELAASSSLPLADPRLGLGWDPQARKLALTASFSGKALGMTALVDKLGVSLSLEGGEPVIELKRPDGIGLALDVSTGISGGGFLGVRGEAFGGVLNLDVGPVEVTAFGLLNPDPFSLIIVLSGEFTPGIQLSFGFMLSGVGGVIGIKHRVDAAGLADAVQRGTVDQLLFPSDPAASAPAILTTLERVFPRDPDSAVFGPLFRLGWGPVIPLMTADAGVILELPEFRFVILGRLRIALPHPDAAIVDLRASLAGLIDPGRGLLEVNVALSGSRVAGLPVSGGLVARVQTSDGGELIFSAGGFHPRYTPPPGLPVPQRLEIKLADLPILQIRFQGYFAITPGTVQAGARLDLVAGTDDLGLTGTLGFDVLLRWSPSFGFRAEVHASLGFKFLGATVCSVSLDVLLEGPSPCWHVAGRASIRVLLARPSFTIDESWGHEDDRPLQPPDVVAEVRRALERREAWAPAMPEGTAGILRLRAPADGERARVHPLGQLSVHQELAPLNEPLTRFGAEPLPAPTPLTISAEPGVALGTSAKRNRFATGQFFTRTEDQLFTSPAFEDFDSGVTIASAGVKSSPDPRVVTMTYEDKSIRGEDDHDDDDPGIRFNLFAGHWMEIAVASGAVARSSLEAKRSRYLVKEGPQLDQGGPKFARIAPDAQRPVAVDTRNGARVSLPGVDGASTYAKAGEALAAAVAADLRLRENVVLAASWEPAP